MATKKPSSLIEEVRSRLQLVIDAESANRAAAQDDLKFAAGDQWPAEIKMQRTLDRRPCLTINKTDTFVRSVVNNMRQQRPRIKVHPVSAGADQSVAEVIEGLIRHIEVSSNADAAYDTGADYQVRMGWGYWRILAKYSDPMGWEQDLYVDRVRNPFSVYPDPTVVAPDGSDMSWVCITGKIKKSQFESKYPGKKVQGWSLVGGGDDVPTKDEVMLIEYYRLEETPEDLVRLSSGESMWASEFTAAQKAGKLKLGVIEVDRRQSVRKRLKWSLLSGADELDSRDLPGRYIPVIPIYGAELIDGGKVIRYGMVRQLKDPQKMYNFWRTQETEFVALAPKAPWLMAEGQDEGHEDEWDNANVKNFSSLKYKVVTAPDGVTPLPPPARQQPQAIPAASVNAAMQASEDLKAVAGMFDPALGAPGQETSGTMVAKRQAQSDLSNYHFYDNETRSIRQTGIVLLDLIPHYYDTKRVLRIIGEDGTPDSVTINDVGGAVDKVLNDLTVGKYDVVMDTGPGYDTKRLEAQEAMLGVLKVFPEIAKIGGDLIIRQFDAPGMNALADRMAALIPAAQMDKQLPKDMDPKVRQFVSGLMMQLQQAQSLAQQLQQEKDAKLFGIKEKEEAITVREMHKEDAETQRLQMKERAEDEREERRLHADLLMNDADNHTSLTETGMTVAANLKLGHMKAQQHGVPNNNRPTNP